MEQKLTNISIFSQIYVTRESDPDDEWDRDGAETGTTVLGIYKVNG